MAYVHMHEERSHLHLYIVYYTSTPYTTLLMGGELGFLLG